MKDRLRALARAAPTTWDEFELDALARVMSEYEDERP
jgi:hypothetical protein